jgi:hypothetical protein
MTANTIGVFAVVMLQIYNSLDSGCFGLALHDCKENGLQFFYQENNTQIGTRGKMQYAFKHN